MDHRTRALLTIGLVTALTLAACTSGEGPPGGTDGVSAERTGETSPRAISQPVLLEDLPVAPESERVDLTMPSFSDPTSITNPLFPVSRQESVLLLGQVDGQAFRTEVTLLPDTRIIEWEGVPVETLVSQYVAYLDGRLHEVAYDLYAQADDGSVWYFGEDVFNFRDGAIVDTHGTWIAGRDGPAAMIMPGSPQVGDVYRPENIPGFVFEEVTVKSVGQSLEGPLGPIDGGLLIDELHMDGTHEDKTFAPGYGEFYTAAGGDVEALALAAPTDALPGPAPGELLAMEAGAAAAFEAARSDDWGAASAHVADMDASWEAYRQGGVPRLIEPRVAGALQDLTDAVDARDAARASDAAIEAARWSLDLQLRHRQAVDVDLARFDLWAAQLLADAAARDAEAVNGDLFSLDYVRDRILHALGGADGTRINTHLEELQEAVGEGELAAAAEAARGLRETLAEIRAAG